MTTQTTTGNNAQTTKRPTSLTEALRALDSTRESLREADQYGQSGFGCISAVARLALLALESPDGHDTDLLAGALDVIWHLADDYGNCVNCAAEDGGAGYTDPAEGHRNAAQRNARAAANHRGIALGVVAGGASLSAERTPTTSTT